MRILTLYPHRGLLGLLLRHKAFDDTQVLQASATATIPAKAPVRCRQCRTLITTSDAAIELAGQHQHVFTNPAGHIFTLVLFRHARCEVAGIPTLEYTWFGGYAWQMALCGNCGSHLGWYYTHPEFPDFYGLIKPQLLME